MRGCVFSLSLCADNTEIGTRGGHVPIPRSTSRARFKPKPHMGSVVASVVDVVLISAAKTIKKTARYDSEISRFSGA